jgi:uncharacterized protein (TIGR03084 family)
MRPSSWAWLYVLAISCSIVQSTDLELGALGRERTGFGPLPNSVGADMTLQQAHEYRDECDALYALLRRVDDAVWTRPTQFKGWTLNDIVGHLHMFDYAAGITLQGADEFPAFYARITAAQSDGVSLTEYTRHWLHNLQGRALLARWRELYQQLADAYADLDPARRVTWAGPPMSVKSCISARQMETWAHGQAVFDLLGQERVENDRIRNIVIMGVNTYKWSFVNRGARVPDPTPYVRLTSPSGAIWEFNAAQDTDRLEGSAVDFCRVVAQTRNIADTELRVHGENARSWMAIAQCFAGPPEQPPPAGSRFRATVSQRI